ncbi:hypothetical protein [Microbispora sp. H10670]|uniref:hypothetical protein n=1 Tax=Microbispora sp. H10670 TaxID=2729108 RepID=UPI0021760F9A|nr:hypothetical protein [Microbispora sp. H10670]
MDLGDGAVVVHDRGERLHPDVDPAGGRVARHQAVFIDVGPVDLELEGHPPAAGRLLHGRADDARAAVRDAAGQPRHVLERADLADPRQCHHSSTDRAGAVGVVAEPRAVPTLPPGGEANFFPLRFPARESKKFLNPAARTRHASFGTLEDRPSAVNQPNLSGCA